MNYIPPQLASPQLIRQIPSAATMHKPSHGGYQDASQTYPRAVEVIKDGVVHARIVDGVLIGSIPRPVHEYHGAE